MGFFEDIKNNKLGQKAYTTHVQANDLQRRGRPSEAKAKFEEAMSLYEQAYTAGCRKSGILISWTVLMMRRGEFERAREMMREISSRGGLSEDAHYDLRVNYSICLWRLGILDKAIETIQYAGKHCKNSSYYSSLGTFLVEQAAQTGDFEAAKKLLDEAMDYDDEDAATLDNLGEMHLQLAKIAKEAGNNEEAIAENKLAKDFFERAYKKKPSQITTLWALAHFAKDEGDKKRAAELIEKALLHYSSRVCPISMEQLSAFRAEL